MNEKGLVWILVIVVFILVIIGAFTVLRNTSNFKKPVLINVQSIPKFTPPSPTVYFVQQSPISLPLPPQVAIPPVNPLKSYVQVVTPPPVPTVFASYSQLETLRSFANTHGITLQGIIKDINSLYYNKYDPVTDHIDLEKIEYVFNVYEALKLLPDSLLATMQGKAVYISTISERPYTILAGDYGGTLKGLNEGIIITQPLGVHNTIHEFGHIVGYHGIEGLYDQNYPQLKQAAGEYNRIFDTEGIVYPPSTLPSGYMSIYSTANKAENFAEHFAFYVLSANEFRQKALSDAKLLEKYNFLKEKVFTGKEY